MKNINGLLKALQKIALGLTLGMSVNANAGLLGLGGTSWKEEVLLHDVATLIVERSQSYGGRHEIGQSSSVKEHTITFRLPDSGKAISWTSEYSPELGRTNFNLLALHLLNGAPYLVVEPNLCLSYNKWGRPNPPYVFFRYRENKWQRISLAEFPAEFKTINLIVNNSREVDIKALERKNGLVSGYVSASDVKKINSSLTQPEYQSILREAIATPGGGCGEMVRTKNGGWIGIGWFRDQPTREACLDYCRREEVSAEYCPCKNLFKSGE